MAAAALAACTIKKVDDDDQSGGSGGDDQNRAGAAGEGGNGGAGGEAGSAGTGGQPLTGPCGDVPVTGKCLNDDTIQACLIPETTDADPKLTQTQCPVGRACRMVNGEARCMAVGDCVEGDISCSADQTKLATCVGSGTDAHWEYTPCDKDAGEQCIISKPGTPAECKYVPSSSGGGGPTFTGRIRYQYRPVKEDRTGWGDTLLEAEATDAYVGIFDGDELIGKALTGYDPDTGTFPQDGTFVAHLTREPTANTQIWVWPMAFNYDTGMPLMAIAKSIDSDTFVNAQDATEYWAWGRQWPQGETHFEFTIEESEGSGAMYIYQWIDAGLLLSGWMLPDRPQSSLIVYWNDTMTPDCGACFCGPACGGGQIKYGPNPNDVDYYDTWIALGGPPDDGSTQWAKSVINHEFGHYLMHNYSKSPGEGGPHYVNRASSPGLAYSEAWATAYAQEMIETPVYVDEQMGTVFWVDISKYDYIRGPLEKPDPDGPIDQPINENVGAGMLWKLWVDANQDPDGRGLGDDQIFQAFTYGPLVDGTFNRGYVKVDLVDFFDAAICSGAAQIEDITAVSQTAGYPYNPASRPCQ